MKAAPTPEAAPARDVESADDVGTVVHAFYHDIEADALLGPFFADVDGPAHRSRMVAFWSSVVFQTGTYRGRPFDPHARMPGLTHAHFARWIDRFQRTVRAHFVGPRADLMVTRAEQISGVFRVKLGLWRPTPADGAGRASGGGSVGS